MFVLLLALACDGDSETPQDTVVEADADTDADTDTDTDTDADADADADPDVVLYGTVTDVDGNPLMARMQMCKESCYFAESGADGRYTFDPLAEGTYSYEIVVLQDGDWATPLVPFALSTNHDSIELSVPVLEQGQPTPQSSPGEVQAAPGLWLTLAQDDLTLPFGADGTMTRGVRIPADHMPPMHGITQEVLAAFYLAPFDAHDEGGMGFRIDTVALGIADKAQVQIYSSNYLTQEWLDLGTFTVSGGEVQGDTLTVLSTLVISVP
ncbi:MAG: hypothetical protein ACI9VR_001429 [Cognaticolwellia sp.]|jgi:hypothetical protein